MYTEGEACWLNHLDAALEKYNSCVHPAIRMTPFEMTTNNIKPIPNVGNINHKNNFPKFLMGGFVRVSDKRNLYSKGYTTNWNRKRLKIHKIKDKNKLN